MEVFRVFGQLISMMLIWMGAIWLSPSPISPTKKESFCILLAGIALAFLSFKDFSEFIQINKAMILGIISFPWEILGPLSIPIYAFIIWEILNCVFSKSNRNKNK